MKPSIYLINPAEGIPSYYGADVLDHNGFSSATLIADLATTTVAAMVPDSFNVEICDEDVTPADLETPARFIGITGKSSQARRMIELARHFRKVGKTVLIGGPHASLCPELFRDECDILIVGEMEEISETIFAELLNGNWKREYVGGKPDLSNSPIPRWDLYPNDRALMGAIQTSRGCPFECEFCDVIQYVGRKQRHKTPDQVIEELEHLYKFGYRSVFLADDNFTVYRRRTKELLLVLKDWNDRRGADRVLFSTQLSIDIAQDDEILELMGAAGPFEVFIGLETPNEESLKETKKRQNIGVDVAEAVNRFYHHGIMVSGGMIVGFDADKTDVFQRQLDFAEDTSIPIFSVGTLVAPDATPLKKRMEKLGRFIEQDFASVGRPWETNIQPAQMSVEQLRNGAQWLCNKLYSPEIFAERLLSTISKLRVNQYDTVQSNAKSSSKLTVSHLNATRVVRGLGQLGPAEEKMLKRIFEAVSKKPEVRSIVMMILFRYAQFRCVYQQEEFWDDSLALTPNFEANNPAFSN